MSLYKKIALLVAALAGAQSAYAATVSSHELARPEGTRHYLVMQPEGLQPALRPVVILLHGHGASAAWMLGQDSFGGYRSQDWPKLAADRR